MIEPLPKEIQLARTAEGVVVESMFPVLDRDGKVIEFKFNNAQRRLDANWGARNLIPKARRLGVSTFVLARWAAACMMNENINAVVVSHERPATQRLLQIVRFMISNMRGPNPDVGRPAKNWIEFKKTGSTFFIGTAGSDNFGRGDAIHRLHCSEYAFWEHPELLKGMLDAVPLKSGEVAIESTGNGHNDFAKRCFGAREREGGVGGYVCHFLNWLEEPYHTLPVGEEGLGKLREDLGEVELEGVLTPEQMAFRRFKILEDYDGDVRMFQQEYPITLEECFQSTGGGIFWRVRYVAGSGRWKERGQGMWALDGHPREGFTYVLGVDVGAGVEKDNSAIVGFCVETEEQVLEWAGNRVPPDGFAIRVKMYGELLDNALVVCENNNHGIVTLSELAKIYPPSRIYRGKAANSKDEVPSLLQMGFRTTAQSKPFALGKLRKAVAESVTIYSSKLKGEMDTYIEDENGKLGAQEGFLDDRVMAAAMGVIGWEAAAQESQWRRRGRVVRDAYDPWSFEGIFGGLAERAKRGKTGVPIKPQHGELH